MYYWGLPSYIGRDFAISHVHFIKIKIKNTHIILNMCFLFTFSNQVHMTDENIPLYYIHVFFVFIYKVHMTDEKTFWI